MKSRVAIVTGGGRGIGKGISLGLARKGAIIAVVYHSNENEANNVVHELKSIGVEAKSYRADVASTDQVKDLMTQVIRDFQKIDILVNNAGVATKSGTEALSDEDWDKVIDVNLKGSFLCSREVIPLMKDQNYGRIINISSIAGQTGGAIGPHYAASKAGVIGLTRFMARELGPFGITVNAIAPSGIPTDLLFDLGFSADAKRPVGRSGNMNDVAAAVCYLASEEASYVTGQVISVNGGSFIG